MTRLGGNWKRAPGPGDLTRWGDPQDEVPPPPCRRCGEEHWDGTPCPTRDRRMAA